MDEKQLRKDINELVTSLEKQAQQFPQPAPTREIVISAILNAKIGTLADIIASRHERISRDLSV
jgi:hypothetical protein